MRRLLIALSVAVVPSVGDGETLAPSTCARTGTEAVVVASVGPGLELALSDGRTIRLAGLEPAGQTPGDSERAETGRRALDAMVHGKTVMIEIGSKTPDRWGRIAAFVFAVGTPGPERASLVDAALEGGVATAAIATGLARYRPEPVAHGCRAAFVAAEAAARHARLGLWGDPYYAVLAVDDDAAFAERSGTIVVVEGRLQAVLTGPYRTKLRFAAPARGSFAGHTLAVTILPRTMKTFEAQHVNFPSLIGRSIRVRGLLDQRFGPQIEISGPDEIDILDETPTAIQRDAAAPARSP